MKRCYRCYKEVRFIRRKKGRPIMVNANPVFFIPDDSGNSYMTSDGQFWRGRPASDGRIGFVIHNCDEGRR